MTVVIEYIFVEYRCSADWISWQLASERRGKARKPETSKVFKCKPVSDTTYPKGDYG